MILTSQTLAHYLVERGLVAPETVVDGDYSAFEMTRRNRNFRVLRGPLPGLFVKQPGDWEPFSTETLRREATCYLLARDDPDFAALGEMMPRFVDFDAPHFVLTVEWLPAAETLAGHLARGGDLPSRVAERLGTLLGRYHRHAGSRARDAARDSAFPRGMPWILNVMHHTPTLVGPASRGNAALVEMLGRYPAFGPALDAVRDGWRRDALVHGDLKWENCLVLPPGEPGAAPELRIVDWELADFGDACWDVGSIFQAYLSSWLLSIEGDAGGGAGPGERAALPIERMRPAIHAFWRAYAATLGLDGAAEADRLRRGILFAGARLIQTAWEHTAHTEHVPPNVLYLMQVAMNVLTRPDDAVRHLLGFEEWPAA